MDVRLPSLSSGRGRAGGLVTVRRTKLTGIAQYALTANQVGFPNVVEVSCYSGELAGAAGEMDRVGDYCVEARPHQCRGGGRRVKRECLAGFGDPVMLDLQDQCVSVDLGTQDGGADRSLQIPGGQPQGCVCVNDAQVGHQHSAHGSAMLMFWVLCSRCGNQKRRHSENRDCFTAFCESHVLLRIVKFDSAVKLCLNSGLQICET